MWCHTRSGGLKNVTTCDKVGGGVKKIMKFLWRNFSMAPYILSMFTLNNINGRTSKAYFMIIMFMLCDIYFAACCCIFMCGTRDTKQNEREGVSCWLEASGLPSGARALTRGCISTQSSRLARGTCLLTPPYTMNYNASLLFDLLLTPAPTLSATA